MNPLWCLAVAVVAALAIVGAAFLSVRRADRREQMETRLRDLFDGTRELDIVDEAFADYQRSIADLLDANPFRSEELTRGLEAATDIWEQRRFLAAVRPLIHDPAFRVRVWLTLRLSRRATTP